MSVPNTARICALALASIQAVSAAPQAIPTGSSYLEELSSPSWQCADEILCRFLPGNPPAKPAGSWWSGWGAINNFVVFGASYTASGNKSLTLDPQANQVAADKATSCNGPNYIDRLVNGYNDSVIDPHLFAFAGAGVDFSVFNDTNKNDFVHQVDSFLGSNLPAGSTANNTLYSTQFGINDIYEKSHYTNYQHLNPLIFKSYEATMDKLYEHGARNFLVMNVAPIDRSPQAKQEGNSTIAGWRDDVIDYNIRINAMVADLGAKHPDATYFLFHANALMSRVLDNPTVSESTKIYQPSVLHDNCQAYFNVTGTTPVLPSPDYKDPSCPYPVNQYFWLSGYHPTYPMHDYMASEIANGFKTL